MKCPGVKWPGDIVEVDSEVLRLNLACGHQKEEGFVGVDLVGTAEIICDLESFPWPFDDSSVDEFVCNHYVQNTNDLKAFMDEVYRIAKPEAYITITHPYYTSIRAWQDPNTKRALSEASWPYFNRAWRVQEQVDHYPINCDFEIVEFKANLRADWANRSAEEVATAIRSYWNVMDDLIVVLKALK